MNSLIHIATICTLIAHAVLGCCWHHGHFHASIADGVTHVAECGHDHEHHGEQPTDHEPTDHEDGCEGTDCVYLREATSLDDDVQAVVIQLFSLSDFTLIAKEVTPTWSSASSETSRLSSAQMRAQRQVFLL